MRNTEQVFTSIFRRNGWGGDDSRSGKGSSLRFAEPLGKIIKEAIEFTKAVTVLDAPCGDYKWMQGAEIPPENYVGVDIVEEMIEQLKEEHPDRTWMQKDITKDELPKADLIVCRHCIVHLSFELGLQAIENFRRSGAKWLLATTFDKEKNKDIRTGGWRTLNLSIEPFNLGECYQKWPEKIQNRKDLFLGLWKL